MNTGKIALRTVEEFMTGYQPVYQPLYPLFLGKSQAFSEQVGKVDFKRVDTVGDIRAKHITPKDTEIKQIAVGESSKSFKKYFLANQFRLSNLQDQQGLEDIIAQVLDEHQKHADELFLLGEGTSAGSAVNNGLFWSADANYTLESSAQVAKGSAADHLLDMHAKIIASKAKADAVAGRKALIVYGTTALAKLNALYSTAPVPFKQPLQTVLGANYSVVEMPAAVTPSNVNGWLIANLDQCKLNYCALPSLKAQGVNEESMYSWHNFLMGSMMLEVQAKDAIIRQPVTFEA